MKMFLRLSLLASLAGVPAIGFSQESPVGGEVQEEPKTAQEWNLAGVSALEKGDFDQAMVAFEKALGLDAEQEVIRRNLARTYGHRGQKRMQEGRLLQALEDFEAGRKVDRDRGYLECLIARAHIRLGRRDQAREVLAEVRKDFPECLPALRLSSELAFVSGQLQQAIEWIRQARRLAPEDASLERRLQQLQQEKEAWEGFLTDASAHFQFRYDPRNPAIVQAVPQLMTDLEDAYQSVAARLGFVPSDTILVLVLDRDRYRGQAPAWSGGLYDGRIRVAMKDYESEKEQLRATLRHEYTHAALHRIGPQLPTWLHEGFAQWVEGRSVQRARGRMTAASKKGPEEFAPLKALDGNWTEWKENDRVSRAYDYSLSFVEFFRESYGDTVYTLLFENLRRLGLEQGFRLTFGKGIAEVDREHRQALALSD